MQKGGKDFKELRKDEKNVGQGGMESRSAVM